MQPATVQTSGPAGERPGATSGAPPLTLTALIEAYLRAYTGRDRSRVLHLHRWVQLYGDRPFLELTDDDVFHGLAAIAAESARVYHGRDDNGQRIFKAKPGQRSQSTVNRYHAALSALFTWAKKRRLAPRTWENPARAVERAPEDNGVLRFLSPDERSRLLEACRGSRWNRLYALALMALTTGARKGELTALTWRDVDLEQGVAYVRDSKNRQPRTLPLVPAVLQELRRFATDRLDARIFPSSRDRAKPRQFDSAWRAALDRARIRSFRFHDLRHSCASYLAQQGASLLEIADVLGHRQLAMTRRYAHLTTDSKTKLVNRILGGIQ